MALLTKAQIRTAVQQAIDDPSAARWTAPNLDVLIGLCYDDLWGDILKWAPNLAASKLDTITTLVSPGYIDLSATGGAGQPTQRFFQARSVVRESREHVYAPNESIIIEDNAVVSPVSVMLDGYYTFYGPQLWIFPLKTTPEVEFRYSFRPAAFTSLSDGTAISFPDGHESALVYEAASRGFTKGDAESMAQVQQLAQDAQARLRASLMPPIQISREPRQLDSPLAWGGR